MKIKPLNKKRDPAFILVDGQWVPYEKPRKQARLGQLAKHNRRARTPSEFLRMCWKLQEEHAY